MDSSSQEGEEKKKNNEVKTFSVPFCLEEIKENISITTNTPPKPSKEQIINQAINFHLEGNIQEASKHYQYCLKQGFKDCRVYSNYGNILKNYGKLQDAELLTRQAIELNPNFAEAHSNLGNILRDLGKLEEAESFTRKAITLNPDLANAHSNLGNILKDLGKSQEAELSIRLAIELNSNFAEAHSNLGNVLSDLGNLQEAELSTRKAIELKPDLAMAHSNLGGILSDLGKLKEAELSLRKAIELNPDFADAHYNLGNTLQELGKLEEAGNSYCKAIELKPNLARAYFSLSTLTYSDFDNKKWQYKLFSESILNNKFKKDLINIYFARSNILHKGKEYKESAKYLTLANNLKLLLQPSDTNTRIKQSQLLLFESDKKVINTEEITKHPQSIFIVGMPRSGSTLLESILSINNDVDALGEINILEESFIEWKEQAQELTLSEIYWKKITGKKSEFNITTNKWLYNYQYAGIIAGEISYAKIIHCFRNPLDNILSIYRAHFSRGNDYSSSLVDCAKVYLDQEQIMTQYKNKFRSKIYDLNYDLLVGNPKQEIKGLISWLGWEWNDSYLKPHLNPRSISTASNVQVRSPINSKSSGGWKNYKDMLQPAIEILTQTNKYKNIIS